MAVEGFVGGFEGEFGSEWKMEICWGKGFVDFD
jgi:hypothetical protein